MREIEDRDKRISDLESKAEKAADVLGKNTAALAQNADQLIVLRAVMASP